MPYADFVLRYTDAAQKVTCEAARAAECHGAHRYGECFRGHHFHRRRKYGRVLGWGAWQELCTKRFDLFAKLR
ncbi:MAG: hypothetical protein IJ172_11780 [Ruminococcus sp.]|nr:hypothetical protein [Ruminococcus sp.]